MRQKRYMAFEIQRMLAKPYFETATGAGARGSGGGGSSESDFEDGDPRPGNSSQTIYHTQEAAQAAADAAGGVAKPGDGVWVVSTSAAASAENAQQSNLDIQYEHLGISEELAGMQMEIAAKQTEIMEEQWQRYLDIYGPIEEEWAQAAAAGLPADYYVSRAAADVEQSFATAEESAARQAGSYGIDPSSARYQGMQDTVDIQKAAAKAGAMTNTRMAINDVNYQRQSDVVKTGRGIPTEAASIGSSASNSLSSAGNQYASGYGGVSQAYNELGNYYATVDAQNKANSAATNAATIGAIGSVVGTAAGVGLGVASL